MSVRIGILGGTFNPVHAGHIGLALRAARELRLDRVLVVPASISPFKTPDRAAPPEGRSFSDGERWDLVCRACAPHAPLLEPCRLELDRGGVSYAIDTVRALRNALPEDAKLFFIVGEDAADGLDKWKDIGRLRELCEFAVFPRTRESSTEIRRTLAAGGDVSGMMPPGVRPSPTTPA